MLLQILKINSDFLLNRNLFNLLFVLLQFIHLNLFILLINLNNIFVSLNFKIVPLLFSLLDFLNDFFDVFSFSMGLFDLRFFVEILFWFVHLFYEAHLLFDFGDLSSHRVVNVFVFGFVDIGNRMIDLIVYYSVESVLLRKVLDLFD